MLSLPARWTVGLQPGLVLMDMLLCVAAGALLLLLLLGRLRQARPVPLLLLLVLLAGAFCSLLMAGLGAVGTWSHGGRLHLAAGPLPDSGGLALIGALAAVVLTLIGLTLRLSLAERRARRRRRELARLRDLVDAAIEGLMVVEDGRIVAVNASLCRLTGRPEHELLGSRLADLLPGAPEARGRTECGDEPVPGTIETAGGERVPVELRTRAISFDGRACSAVAARDLRGSRQAEAHIRFLSLRDPLTGLWNRAAFTSRLEDEIERLGEGDRVFALLVLDIDRFEQVNDEQGHEVGDRVLRVVAGALQDAAAPGEIVARLGSDEFALLCPGAATAGAAAAVAERLALLVRRAAQPACGEPVTVSVGISLFPADGTNAARLLLNADAALARAKQEGGAAHRFFDPALGAAWRERRRLERDLRRALAEGKLSLAFQPQARVANGQVIGFEALARWQHPARGWVPPAEFIKLAEEVGLIHQLGDWVLRTACREAARWRPDLTVSVNVSPVQLVSGDFARTVKAALEESGLPARQLELEVTESALLHDSGRSIETLRRLKDLGLSIAIDDFGTGYSSLATLRAFSFDRIKIDRSFVTAVHRSEQGAMIVRTILGLARGLGLPVVAEGVEAPQELAFLRREDCQVMQGNLIGRPAPIGAFHALTVPLAEAPARLPQRQAVRSGSRARAVEIGA